MANYQPDDIDQKILGFLISNARMPYLEIARSCGVSGAAIHQRVKKMENSGVINGARLLVNPKALGLGVCAYIAVSLKASFYKKAVEEFKKVPEIVECHFVTGEFSLLLKVQCKRDEDLMKLIINTIQAIPEVTKTETWLSLDQPIDRNIWINGFNAEASATAE